MPISQTAYRKLEAENQRLKRAVGLVLEAWPTGRGLYGAMQNLTEVHQDLTEGKHPRPQGAFVVRS